MCRKMIVNQLNAVNASITVKCEKIWDTTNHQNQKHLNSANNICNKKN